MGLFCINKLSLLLVPLTWAPVPQADVDGEPLGRLDGETTAAVNASVDRALAYLASSQQPDGGWRGFEGSDPAITALAAKCFAQHADYGTRHEIVRRAFDFILKHTQEDGGIYVPGIGLRNYYTSVALMTLSTADDPRAKAAADQARKFLTRLQWDEDEGYGRDHVFYGGAGYGRGKRPDLSNTQMMLEALHQSGLPAEHPVYAKALVFVSRCQMLAESNDQPFAVGGDGGFIYSPAGGGESKAGTVEVDGKAVWRSYGSMTYAGFKSLLYAQVDRRDIRVRRAVDWIRGYYTLEQNPNMPQVQSRQGLYYFYHVFARALAAWGEETIIDRQGVRHDWRKELCARLLSLQRRDGSWVNDEDRWYESNPYLVTAYSVLAMQTALQ